MKLSISAWAFITLTVVLGLSVLAYAAMNASAVQVGRLAVLVLIACLAARLKVKLPGLTGSMSVNLPFILLAVAQMGLLETLIIACLSNLTQNLPAGKPRKKFNLVQTAFNVCTMALAVAATRLIYGWPQLAARVTSLPVQLAIAAAAFFLVNTVAIAIIFKLTESRSFFRGWLDMFQLSYPYYLASAGVAAVALTLPVRAEWQLAIAILPLMAGVFYSYRRYFSSLTQAVADSLRRPMQSQGHAAADSAKAGA